MRTGIGKGLFGLVCKCSIAVTNYYKLSGLKQHMYFLTVQEARSLTGLKSAGLHSFLEALVENPLCCFSQLLETVHILPLASKSAMLNFSDHASIILYTYADVSSTEKIQAMVMMEPLTNQSAHH